MKHDEFDALSYILLLINQSIICYGAPIRRSGAPNNKIS